MSRRLGFDRHFFAVDYLRAQAGLALEHRDLDTAEQLTEQALSISERRRPFYEFLTPLDRAEIWAARGQVRAAQPDTSRPRCRPAEPLTATELRILQLLPTSTPLQVADTLYVSRNTVKTHLRSIYQKLGVASRPEAVERAVDLHLL